MELEVIIGLEIHAQMNTKTKFFCGCDNDSFGKTPNTNVCPICMGYPGQLPVPNAAVIQKAIASGLALECTINTFSKFDRKQYFYPDSPKGFQITQYDKPITERGKVTITVDGKEKDIHITRMHIEDDAGKLSHTKDASLCDFNRAGTPLMEIVSEPDLRSVEEARLYAQQIQSILRYVDASDCDMEKGMMRFDASVSLRPKGVIPKKYKNLPVHSKHGVLFPRAEIKNLNSFRSLEAALEYQIQVLKEKWENDDPLMNDITVGWIDDEKRTHVLREKESAADYRYFPEPDIPPIILTHEEIQAVKDILPELPRQKKQRYMKDFHLTLEEADFLVADKDLARFFEETVKESNDARACANWILSTLLKSLKDAQMKITEIKFTSKDLAGIITLIKSGDISGKIAKDVFPIMFETGKSPKDIVEEKGWKQVSDTSFIEEVVRNVLKANPQSVGDFKNGKEKALAFLVGQVMKETKGQANPQIVNEILRKHM